MDRIRAEVYRGSGDCTNGGVTSKTDHCILFFRDGDGVPDEINGQPVLILSRRTIGGREHLSAVPPMPHSGSGPMFGGNFIYSCDSRFPSEYPIPVHDRFEHA